MRYDPMMCSPRITVGIVTLVTSVAMGSAMAADRSPPGDYPNRPVRVVIGWPAGGSNDMTGRIVAQRLGELLGQQFVVDNRPGAAGTIGAEIVAKAVPDGYTIMVHSATHAANAALYRKLPYDTVRDFTPIALVATQPTMLVVHPGVPIASVKDLIALARAKPGQLNYGSAGNGSAPHLSAALFARLAGVELTHVPYKGGPPSITALLGGEVQLLFATVPTVISQVRAGKLRAVALCSAKRSPLQPELPTIAESGVPGYEMSPWQAVFGPARLPAAVVARLNESIDRVLRSADAREALANQGMEPLLMGSKEFPAYLSVEIEKYAKLIKEAGARMD